MTIIACGINHLSAPIAIREKVAFSDHNVAEPLLDLIKQAPIHEAAILSTCNRTEIYCDAEATDSVLRWFAERQALPLEESKQHLYIYRDQDALIHMMRVASGLDSMMLGETQIFGQMKQAFQKACEIGTVGNFLRPCFEHIFRSTKLIRSATELSRHATSVAAAAVEIIHQHLGDLSEANIVLIGAGDTIELTANHLISHGARDLRLANRTVAHAEALAEKIGGSAHDINDLIPLLKDADAVISATACPLPFLHPNMLPQGGKRKCLLFDLAMPRDIDSSCNDLDHVTLYNIDDLQGFVSKNMEKRQLAANQAEILIQQEAEEFQRWQRTVRASDSIKNYRQHIESLGEQELMRARQLLSAGDDPALIMEQFAQRLINKVTHQPTVRLRQASSEGRDDILVVARQLFDVDLCDTETS